METRLTKLKKFCEWLGKESVNIEINNKFHNGNENILFLRWVRAFYRHLNDKEKEQLKKRLPNIEANIEAMLDKNVLKDIKEALKCVK